MAKGKMDPRQGGRVQAMATVVAVGVITEGDRRILGVAAGPSEHGPFGRRSCRAWSSVGCVG
jgi:transposase-like protein